MHGWKTSKEKGGGHVDTSREVLVPIYSSITDEAVEILLWVTFPRIFKISTKPLGSTPHCKALNLIIGLPMLHCILTYGE